MNTRFSVETLTGKKSQDLVQPKFQTLYKSNSLQDTWRLSQSDTHESRLKFLLAFILDILNLRSCVFFLCPSVLFPSFHLMGISTPLSFFPIVNTLSLFFGFCIVLYRPCAWWLSNYNTKTHCLCIPGISPSFGKCSIFSSFDSNYFDLLIAFLQLFYLSP